MARAGIHITFGNLRKDESCKKYYLPADEALIPTGELRAVAGSPMDFTSSHTIGERIDQVPGGYDHCCVIRESGEAMKPAARLVDPGSGRVLEIATTEPAIQFYSGNFLNGTDDVAGFRQHHGLCLEAEVCPDAPNKPDFPNSILHPDETCTQTTVHRFRVLD